jgi:hypothetical protein
VGGEVATNGASSAAQRHGAPAEAVLGGEPSLLGWCDPEWLPGLAFLLLPAAFCAAAGAWRRASFFAGAAAYIAVLRWLGWAFLNRRVRHPLRYALLGPEFFAGLGLLCLWFYLRNLVGRLVPGSYSLVELRYLFAGLLAAQLVAALWRLGPALRWVRANPREVLGQLAQRAAFYVPFCFLLTVALWQVSDALGVQTTDSITHAFTARVYRDDGMYWPGAEGTPGIVYPAGFGAMNAVTAAVSGLGVAQVLNLQHVLLIIMGLFTITGSVAVWCGHPMPLLHTLPLVLVCFFPLYSLYPDCRYEANARQAATPLLVAACFLPLLPVGPGRWRMIRVTAGVGLLCVLTVALNPSSAPLAGLALLLATLLMCLRSRRRWGCAPVEVLAWQVLLVVLASAAIIGPDVYYDAVLEGRAQRLSVAGAPGRSQFLSVADALRSVKALDLLTLPPSASFTDFQQPVHYMQAWWRHMPEACFPAGALGLAAIMLVLIALGRVGEAGWSVARILAVCMVLWLVLRLGMGGLVEGVSRESVTGARIKAYIGFLLLRADLLVLYTTTAAVGAGLYLLGERLGWRRMLAQSRLLGLFAVLVAVLPYALVIMNAAPAASITRAGYITIPIAPSPHGYRADSVTPDDLKLVAWAEANIGGNDLVGLACRPIDVPVVGEHHMYPYGPAQAYLLYARGYNACFYKNDPHFPRPPVREYIEHVQDSFDAAWCLRHGIRFFYIPRNALHPVANPGGRALAQALKRGALRLAHQEGESAIYEVAAPAQPG